MIRIILIILILTNSTAVWASEKVVMRGHVDFNGEFIQPKITASNIISSDKTNITPEFTLSYLISNIGGFKEKSDFKNIKLIRNDNEFNIDITKGDNLNYKLKNGDIIEIQEQQKLTLDEKIFLKFTKMNLYQNSILIHNLKTQKCELCRYSSDIIDIISKYLAKNNKILIKRVEKSKFKTFELKPKVLIKPNDIVLISGE